MNTTGDDQSMRSQTSQQQVPRDSTMDFSTTSNNRNFVDDDDDDDDDFRLGNEENNHLMPDDGGQQEGRNTTPTRVRQFMNILEQLPRLCSPTICGTLSQPTTRNERASCGADMFEWSIEQKALLSPANITEDWQNVAGFTDLDPAWRKQESEMFFSQKTIAPSPLVVATTAQDIRARRTNRSIIRDEHMMHLSEEPTNYEDRSSDNDDNDGDENEQDDDDDVNNNQDDEEQQETDNDDNQTEYYMDDEEEQERQEDEHDELDDEFNDDFMFSPAPVRSSQKMDVFSPATFSRVMEDENTLQSTPKTTGLPKPARTRMDILDDQ